jgi:hypothetical protein
MERMKPNPEFDAAMRELEAEVRKTARLPLLWPK